MSDRSDVPFPAGPLSQKDVARRLRLVLPPRWFPPPAAGGEEETAPVLAAFLEGFAAVLAPVSVVFVQARRQLRLATMAGGFLDMFAQDFYGANLPRAPNESDDRYRQRIKDGLFLRRNTRPALEEIVKGMIGREAIVIEPRHAGDCKGYGSLTSPAAGGGYGWGAGPRGVHYGSLNARFQLFILLPVGTSDRPETAVLAGIARTIPAGIIGWVRNIEEIS